MLDFIRNKAQKSVLKFVIVLIILPFVFIFGGYFSSSSRLQISGNESPVVTVNGEPIPYGTYQTLLDSQLKRFSGINKEKIPPELSKIVQHQTLQSLIQELLWSQLADQIGIKISEVELEKTIREDPNFKVDGKFNSDFYLNRLRPFFEENYGQSYEVKLNQELKVIKVKELVQRALPFTNLETADQFLLNYTELNLEYVRVPKNLNETQSEHSPDAASLTKEIIATWQKGSLNKDWLKKNSLTEITTGLKPLKAIINLFPESTETLLACVLKEPNGLCPEPIDTKNHYLVVKLIEYKKPEPKLLEEKKNSLREQGKLTKAHLILSNYLQQMQKEAKIKSAIDLP